MLLTVSQAGYRRGCTDSAMTPLPGVIDPTRRIESGLAALRGRAERVRFVTLRTFLKAAERHLTYCCARRESGQSLISILMFLVAVHMLLAVYQAAAVSILMFLVMVARRDLRHTYAAASRSVTFLKV